MYYASGICPEHTFGRCAIHPKFVNSSGVFDNEQTFQLMEIKEIDPTSGRRVGTGVYALSIASVPLAGGPDGVHTYGQWAANHQNSCYEERTGSLPDPASIYVGYIELDASIPLHSKVDHHEVRVRWLPEHEQQCHFQIEASVIESGTKAERRNARAKISNRIAALAANFIDIPQVFHVANEVELCRIVHSR